MKLWVASMTDSESQQDISFKDEVKSLLGGVGWGMRWLGISLAWGLSLFVFMAMIGYALFVGSVERPGPYYGLVVILGLMTIVLSIWLRRY